MSTAGPSARQAWLEVAWVFLRLGCVSFGGPVAHLSYFRNELVDRRAWLDEAEYADLVALCQFLPGPASSQVVFALGMRRAGLLGALLASLCFTLPSALLMVAFAYGLGTVDPERVPWLRGLKLAAVAVVGQAVWTMGRKACVDRVRISLCVGAAAMALLASGGLVQLVVVATGAAVGAWRYRATSPDGPPPPERDRGSGARTFGAAALVAYAVLLAALPVFAAWTSAPAVAVFDRFYRAGALVLGGGHVVLPLLRAELVPSGWLTDDQFLAGYAAAQALPGPMFAFSAYAGASLTGVTWPRWAAGLGCTFAMFLPAWLMIGGALPFWVRLRRTTGAQAALAGANASVVGLLLAALYHPVITESVHGPADVAVVLVAFAALEAWQVTPWLVVAACAVATQLRHVA